MKDNDIITKKNLLAFNAYCPFDTLIELQAIRLVR